MIFKYILFMENVMLNRKSRIKKSTIYTKVIILVLEVLLAIVYKNL